MTSWLPLQEPWNGWIPTPAGELSEHRTGFGYGVAMQERVKKSGTGQRDEDVEPVESAATDSSRLKSDLDDLLDDIDQVLEENAEEFVKNYVQKGGQ